MQQQATPYPDAIYPDAIGTQSSSSDGLFATGGTDGLHGYSVPGNNDRLLTFETAGLDPPTAVPRADDGAWEEMRAAVVLAAAVVVVAAVSATVSLIWKRLPH